MDIACIQKKKLNRKTKVCDIINLKRRDLLITLSEKYVMVLKYMIKDMLLDTHKIIQKDFKSFVLN